MLFITDSFYFPTNTTGKGERLVCFLFFSLPGGGDDAYEQVPTILQLFSADRCSVGLHVALLSVTQVHKAEVWSGLVKQKLQLKFLLDAIYSYT